MGETEVSPEALVEPASGLAVMQGGVSTVVEVDSCGICGELLSGQLPKPSSGDAEFSPRLRRLRERRNSLPRVRPCSVVRTSHPDLFEHSSRHWGAVAVILGRASS